MKFGRTKGIDGVIDVPLVYVEGGDEFDDYRAPEFGPDDEADPDQAAGGWSANDTRDIDVDVHPDEDGDYVSTVRVPIAGGKTVVAQSTKAKTAKAAVAKGANIAKLIAEDKTVQNLLPPSAKLTVAALKSSTAKKVYKALGF